MWAHLPLGKRKQEVLKKDVMADNQACASEGTSGMGSVSNQVIHLDIELFLDSCCLN